MKKLNVAIIGQGRSGKSIHGSYYTCERNVYYNVKYVVEFDERRRRIAEEMYEGAIALCDYKELFDKKDIDLVVNVSYSEMHYSITKDLLEHGFNVMVDKPFAKTRYECDDLIRIAKEKGVLLAVFHNSQPSPFFIHAQKLIKDGVLGDIKQISIRYSGFARRWDWQTLQKKVAGSAYNTGPHPIALALGFLDFDKNFKVEYSKLDLALTSGDAEDYVKILLTAPEKPLIDIEINSTDAFSGYNLKIQGSKGTLLSTPSWYKMKYIVDGENPPQPVIEESLQDENGNPLYCSEKLITHEENGDYEGTAFDLGTAGVYESVYNALTKGEPLFVTPEQAAMVISVIETCHAQNPLPLKW
ncbi:MAG: Gfo/Idh/MocA family oxidoreductase [Clostridia bacterium]|nr:Gfo/Idh/MocA family oxidoreductase [Clostridia bacterium]